MMIRDNSRPGRLGPGRDRPRAAGRWFARVAVPLALAAGPLACAPAEARKSVVPARGEVSFEGRPVARALVVFHPTDDPVPNALDPRAVVEPDGTFAVSTHDARDGAPPGRYAVTVHDLKAGPTPDGGPPSPAVGRLPARYADPARSGLAAEVRPAAPNSFSFRLTR